MCNTKPILVTGSHRSGTTWVGRTIAFSPIISYIQEPFNPNRRLRPGISAAKIDTWYQYICSDNQSSFYHDLKNTLNFKYSLFAEISCVKKIKDFKRLYQDYCNTKACYRLRKRPLMKDPIAFFSSEWLASTFNMDVIVLIRHPAAFAWSLKRLNWTHPFKDFLKQPLLMKRYLYPFEKKIREYSEKEQHILDQAILLWRLIYHTAKKFKEQNPNWLFLKHEDISQDPASKFSRMFKKLNLEYSDKIIDKIKNCTKSSNPLEIPDKPLEIKRDTRSNIKLWKDKLSDLEITKIRSETEDISPEFYTDQDW